MQLSGTVPLGSIPNWKSIVAIYMERLMEQKRKSRISPNDGLKSSIDMGSISEQWKKIFIFYLTDFIS